MHKIVPLVGLALLSSCCHKKGTNNTAQAQDSSQVSTSQGATPSPHSASFVTSIPLTVNANGMDGYLNILLDESLPKDLRNYSPLDDSVIRKNAVLQILDSRGTIKAANTLERSIASFDTSLQLSASPNWIPLVVDYASQFASYNGPMTIFCRVKNSKLEWLSALHLGENQFEIIALMRSLTSDWRFFGSTHSDTLNIFQVVCQPNLAKTSHGGFYTIYSRYYSKANKWFCVDRVENRYWKSDDSISFPSYDKFKF